MKKTFKSILFIIAAAAVIGCAKMVSESANDANRRYLEAWKSVNYPDAATSELGTYIIDSQEGNGASVEKDGYAIVEFTATDLEGNISSYTDKEVAQQLGQYDSTAYYGPQVWITADQTIQAGIQEALLSMKVGGSKTVVIPSWLMTYESYSSVEEYLKHETDYSNSIYSIRVVDFTKDIDTWQISKMKEYMAVNYGGVDTFQEDTVGFYYKGLSQKTGKEEAFPSDTTIYINYTGKLLNGLVFDTNIEKTAWDHGLYSESKTYGPVKITWSDTYSGLTMGNDASSVITGFARTLWDMRNLNEEGKYDKGVGIFYSPLGYGYSGSGSSIPPYAPLVFEIEIVENPEE